MVEIDEIRDRQSLGSWLQDKSAAVAVAISLRNALRVAPLVLLQPARGEQGEDLTSLQLLHGCLVAGVISWSKRSEIFEAAFIASRRALDATADPAFNRTVTEVTNGAFAAVTSTTSASEDFVRGSDASGDAATSGEAAEYAVSRAYGDDAVSALWQQIRTDAVWIEKGEDILHAPLWDGVPPKRFSDWIDELREHFRRDLDLWSFWLRWWEGMLSGHHLPDELLEAVALIPEAVWVEGPEAVAKAIRKIEDELRSPIASASLFDFVEVHRRMRMVGFETDLAHVSSPDAIRRFNDDTEELLDDFADWRDYATEKRGQSNAPGVVVGAVEKIIGELNRTRSGATLRVRRLVALGSDLRRFALEEANRQELGEALSKMLDERLDRYGEIVGRYLGPALQRLESLQRLELGTNDPTELVAVLREAVAAIQRVPSDELRDLEPEAQATLEEMIRELDDLDAAISEARSNRAVEVLRERFAAKYGGVSATLGRYVERAREASGKPLDKLDDLVKWFKRWETLDAIKDWLTSWFS
ncbi:MAG: hypothetical protein KDE00_00440 [Rhodobacteraceae bacterium]|nr:hypothetical protein [Paracoccaceae bacterium]